MSRGSIYLVGWLGVGLLMADSSHMWSHQHLAPTDPLIERFELPIEGSYLVIPVSIRDREYQFILDTGCAITVVDLSLLKNETPLKKVVTVNGFDKTYPLFEIEDAYVGESQMPLSGPVIGMDVRRPFAKHVRHDLGGILGMSFLRDYVVSLDQEQGAILFCRRVDNNAGERIPIQFTQGGITQVTVNISGIGPQAFLIDTGYIKPCCGSLSRILLEKPLAEGTAKIVRTTSRVDWEGTESKRDVIRLRDLGLGRFEYPNLEFVESTQNILGMGFLSIDNVIFDFPRLVMYVRRTDVGRGKVDVRSERLRSR